MTRDVHDVAAYDVAAYDESDDNDDDDAIDCDAQMLFDELCSGDENVGAAGTAGAQSESESLDVQQLMVEQPLLMVGAPPLATGALGPSVNATGAPREAPPINSIPGTSKAPPKFQPVFVRRKDKAPAEAVSSATTTVTSSATPRTESAAKATCTSIASTPDTAVESPTSEIARLRLQNLVLTRNISRLFLTAKKELTEKNAEIARLRSLVPEEQRVMPQKVGWVKKQGRGGATSASAGSSRDAHWRSTGDRAPKRQRPM